MITEIYLVRHAHSDYSPDELGRGLSECGKEAACHGAALLQREQIEVFISSPYRRAVETIEGGAKALGLPIIPEEAFKERVLASGPVDHFAETVEALWKSPDLALPGGESNLQAQQRGTAAVVQVLQDYKGKRVAVGTHGNIMALIMNCFDDTYDYEFWKKLSMPDIYKLTFEGKELKDVQRIWKR